MTLYVIYCSFQKINKRLRIEDLDENSDDDEDQAKKRQRESIDSDVDEELLKVC